MMCGWISFPTRDASLRNTLWNRRRRSESTPSAALTNLIATSRLANGSRPRKTRLVPPRPISRVTGYLPILAGSGSSMVPCLLTSSRDWHFHSLHYRGPRADYVVPALDVGEVGQFDLVPFMARHPRIGGNVRHRVFRSEPFVRAQMSVHDPIQPAGLLAVALDRVLHRLRRGTQEMVYLAEHRADAAHLEHQPLDCLEAPGFLLRQETPGLVRQIQQDCAGFEQGIRFAFRPLAVHDRRNLAIRADGNEAGFELIPLADVDRMHVIGKRQFLQHDGDFASVRRAPSVQVDQRYLPMEVWFGNPEF